MGNEEKQSIERSSAEAFVSLYNKRMKTDFLVVKMDDAPDALCKDSENNELNVEITMTEDSKGDIAAILGRSDKKSPDALRVAIKSGNAMASCLQGNVLGNLQATVKKKSQNDYGSNCALLVRATSPVPWDWDLVVDEALETTLSAFVKPFPKGIWLLSFDRKSLYCLHPGYEGTWVEPDPSEP